MVLLLLLARFTPLLLSCRPVLSLVRLVVVDVVVEESSATFSRDTTLRNPAAELFRFSKVASNNSAASFLSRDIQLSASYFEGASKQ